MDELRNDSTANSAIFCIEIVRKQSRNFNVEGCALRDDKLALAYRFAYTDAQRAF
jgi:hypothetical protein